jgi:hypothetical protein
MFKFPLLRRAMRALPYNTSSRVHVFCIVTDTISRLANFSPAKRWAGSIRLTDGGLQLFPPFTLFKTIDLWWKRFEGVSISCRARGNSVLHAIRTVWRDEEQSVESARETNVQLPPAAECMQDEMSESEDQADRPDMMEILDGESSENGETQEIEKPAETTSMQIETAEIMEADSTSALSGNTSLRNCLTLALLLSFEFMAAFGRPMYFGFYQYRPNNKAVGTVALLMAKLLGGTAAGKQKHGHFTKGQALGVLGGLVSYEVSASSSLASELSSEYMRLIAGISDDRECVYTLEVSEPCLALAAHSLILASTITWSVILRKFRSCVLRSTTSIGFRGEVAAQIILVMAFQSLLKTKLKNGFLVAFPEFTAEEFLLALFGQLEFNIPAKVRARLKLCFVRLYQFVKTFADPNARMLFEYFIRGGAIYCKEMQNAIDLIIPLFCPTWNSSEQVSESAMSGIFVQIKLHQKFDSAFSKNNWLKKIRKFVNGRNFIVGIYLEFRAHDSSPPTVDVVEFDGGVAFFCERPCPSMIKDMSDCSDDFMRLLESVVDPAKLPNINQEVRKQMRDMFQCQPYNFLGPTNKS